MHGSGMHGSGMRGLGMHGLGIHAASAIWPLLRCTVDPGILGE